MAQPLYRDGTAYLMDRRTGINAFDFKTGKILWTANNHYEPKDRNPQATLVWVGNTEKVLLLNSLGELILVEFSRWPSSCPCKLLAKLGPILHTLETRFLLEAIGSWFECDYQFT